MRKVAALVVLVWLIAGLVIELASYLPFDPEWTLLATPALFATTFVVGAFGAYFMAPELVRIPRWPAQLRPWIKWLGVAWAVYTVAWFVYSVLFLPGVPTHCGTLGTPACGHEYVFNSHGFLTVTDRAGFLAGVRISVRGFAGPPVAVLALILVAYELMNRRHARTGSSGSGPPAAVAANQQIDSKDDYQHRP
jgi:hypothetical protein